MRQILMPNIEFRFELMAIIMAGLLISCAHQNGADKNSPHQDNIEPALARPTPKTLPAPSYEAYKITRQEVQDFACPQAILDAGASPKDCQCAREKLWDMGQDGARLAALEQDITVVEENPDLAKLAPRRDTAIGLLRVEAFKACGFFEEGHIIGAGL